MNFTGRRILVCLCLMAILPAVSHGQPPSEPKAKKNKVIIYPAPGESIADLKRQGIKKIDNYGSYWLVEATDAEVETLKRKHGDRAVRANYLNKIELAAVSVDTTGDEPAIPSNLKEKPAVGKRLRLVQFKGPVLPEWLDELKGAGRVRVMSYVPNNAYLVWLDQKAEQRLQNLMEPDGPIQWISAYHPYYKIQKRLLSTEVTKGGAVVPVRITLVDGKEANQVVNTLQSYALGGLGNRYDVLGQTIVEMHIRGADIAQIAHLPEILWIEKALPKGVKDEKQDLLLATRTNQLPGHAPIPPLSGGERYLDFLLNTVGGGLPSFTDPSTYPIVDIADTGFDTRFLAHPDFYEFGDPSLQTRVAYAQSAEDFDSGCPKLNPNFAGFEDFCGHGTFVASIVGGYSDLTDEDFDCVSRSIRREENCITNEFEICTTNRVILCDGAVPPNCTTNVTIDCNFTNQVICTTNNITILTTNTFSIIRQDFDGFQFGMGVSPFGLIGSTRIFSQDAELIGSGECLSRAVRINDCVFCLQSPVALAQSAYLNRARIQNNSWGEVLDNEGRNAGKYTTESRVFDIAVRDALLTGSTNTPGPSPLNQEFVVVFAGGNAGSVGDVGGFGDVLITAPATAKNIIAVGATENVRLDGSGCLLDSDQNNSFDVSGFSSFGPCEDGRYKPEIMAPGSSIYGALTQLRAVPGLVGTQCEIVLGNPFLFCEDPGTGSITPLITDLYDCSAGTSFAAPAVSGGIQLLWWYFQNRLIDEFGQIRLQPSPAMAKAYLSNSARYLPIPSRTVPAEFDTLPSIAQGMGIMDLERMFDAVPRVIRDQSAPRATEVALYRTNIVAQQTYFSRVGQTYEVSGEVNDPTKPFRVTLAWTDSPGNPAAFKQLINDLDLEVTIGGQTYKGNVFQYDRSVTGGVRDDINNIESVHLPGGQTGIWSVVVRAQGLAGDGVPNVGGGLDQDFALLVYNANTNMTVLSDLANRITNDMCQTAINLTNFPVSFTNTLSSPLYRNLHPSPSIAGGGIEEFFRIPLPAVGTTFTVDTLGSDFDTLLSIWRGECGSLTEITANDNIGASRQSQVVFTARTNANFYIVVEGRTNATGQVVLNVQKTDPALSIDPAVLEFGNQAVGTTSNPRIVTLRNNGSTPVNISNVRISGQDADDFSIGANGCAGTTLLPGFSCAVSIRFRPESLLTSSAFLVIESTDPASPQMVPLAGTGVPGTALINVSPTSINFGTRSNGTTSAAQPVTISSSGSAQIIIQAMELVGANPADFAVTSACLGQSINPGASCVDSVTFTPTAAGSRTAILRIVSNASNLPTNDVQLSGIGEGVSPAVSLSTTNLAFGGQTVGTTGAVLSVTLTNSGTGPLQFGTISLTGLNASQFIIAANTCAGGTIQPGGTCVIGVQFAPTSQSAKSAMLTIHDNASGSPRMIVLSGTGTVPSPSVCLSAASLSFGERGLGFTSAVQSVVLTNCGSADLVITNVVLAGAGAGQFLITSDTCGGSTIASGGTCTFEAAFAPTALGEHNASASIANNASGSPHTVELSGTGVMPAPRVCLSSTSIAFGSTGLGSSSAPRSLTVTNCGSAPLVITNVTVVGGGAGVFSVSGDTCSGQTIAFDGTCSLNVTFTPTGTGSFVAGLSIANNASGSPHQVNLTGEGLVSQPDALISRSLTRRRYIGDGVYTPPSLVDAQTIKQSGRRGRTRKFYVRVQNDGTGTDRFFVQGDGDLAGSYTVRYFLGAFPAESLDITPAVKAGIFLTSSMNDGAETGNSTLIRVEVTINRDGVAGPNPVQIIVTSESDPTKSDRVVAAVPVR